MSNMIEQQAQPMAEFYGLDDSVAVKSILAPQQSRLSATVA